jgi:hypothetical protein
MRLRALLFGALLTLLGPLAAFSSPQTGAGYRPARASNQRRSPLRKDDPPGVRLLNADEGVSLVNTAWEQRELVKTKPDCSHLVHQVYELSGFPYPYASSYDLYDGVDDFQRVTAPRPGDLIVWRGHVGIVFDAAEHTFYSSVRSGLRTENYDAPYWKAQGRPRFYRYVLRGSVVLSAANEVAPPDNSPNDSPSSSPSSSKTSSSAAGTAVVPVRRVVPAATPPAARSSLKAEPPSVAPTSAASLDRPPLNRTPSNPTLVLPSQIMIVSAASRPTKEEVGEAISEFANAAGNLLRGWPSDDPTRSGRWTPVGSIGLPRPEVVIPKSSATRDLSAVPVLVYDRLTVEGLDLRSDRGSARVEIEGRLSIGGERLEAKHRREETRWEIRRTRQGWQVLAPQNRAYIPSDVAVRVLANQLALLTQNEPASGDKDRSLHQQAMIIRALGLLLEPNQ